MTRSVRGSSPAKLITGFLRLRSTRGKKRAYRSIITSWQAAVWSDALFLFGPHYAKVISIISDTSSVSATVLATSNNLIVSGSLQSIQSDGTILFSQLSDPDNNVSVGDKVVTSNISDKYLPGILIGYIDSISTSSNNLTKSGTVTPAVDFSHLDEVLVVMEQKQQTGD